MLNIPKKNRIVEVKDATILFHNFAGRGTDNNMEGARNFNLVIEDEDIVRELAADGWNVKEYEYIDSVTHQKKICHHVKVNVSYRFMTPLIRDINMESQTWRGYTEADVDKIDGLIRNGRIEKIHSVVISGSPYNRNGRSGISGYLESMDFSTKRDLFSDFKPASFGAPEELPGQDDEDAPF